MKKYKNYFLLAGVAGIVYYIWYKKQQTPVIIDASYQVVQPSYAAVAGVRG